MAFCAVAEPNILPGQSSAWPASSHRGGLNSTLHTFLQCLFSLFLNYLKSMSKMAVLRRQRLLQFP